MRRAILFASFLLCALTAAAQTITLEQNWELLPDPDAKYTLLTLPKDGWRPVRVGLSWNAQFEDMRDFGGVGWYRTTFSVLQFSTPYHILLDFAACDYYCEVFINGNKVGQHEGGYTPFAIEVTSNLSRDSNELIVRVTDPPRDPKRNQQLFPRFMYDDLPHGKQHWYVQTGGLWQPVTLLIKPRVFVRRVAVTPDTEGNVKIIATLAGVHPLWNEFNIHVRVSAGDESFATDVTKSLFAVHDWNLPPATSQRWQEFSDKDFSFNLQVRNPQVWSPEDPRLYHVRVAVEGLYSPEDAKELRFGFRSLTTHDGKLYLNGKPFYMIGALDQDFYPATIYTPPSPEYLRDEMRKAKALGLNTLRCHIKVCTPDYLDAADEVGMLVWYEIPSWNDEHHWTQQAADRGMQVFREALERDWNHPSLAIQSIINESWGANLKDPLQRKWLASTYDEAKKLVAPLGRLIDDNSACCENFHVKSDLADFHQYYSIPDHAEKWSKWVGDFASRPKWIWSPYSDAQPTGNEPLIVSEFGNWGLPKLPCGDAANGKGTASAVPADANKITTASAPAGSSDCNLPWWFSRDFNGREITMPAGVTERFHQYKLDRIFSSYNDLAEATQWHQFESLKYEIQEIRSHRNIQGYVITEFTDVNWESNGLMDIWRNPKAYAKELAQIQLQDAARIDWKRQPIHIPDRRRQAAAVSVNADVPGALRVLSTGSNAMVLLASRWDGHVSDQLAGGKTVILLADSADAFPTGFPIQIKTRERNNYNGDWISNFNWILPSSPVFQEIAFNKIMGFEAQAVTPNYVLLGVKPEQFDDVLSGAFYGWIHDNAALLLQAKYGKGKMLITTLRFDQYGKDPYATYLLDNMIRYVASPQFAPKLTLEPQ